LRAQLLTLAQKTAGSPLAGTSPEDVTFADGQIRVHAEPARAVALTDALRHGKLDAVEAEASAGPGPQRKDHATYAHSAICAEVQVDPDLGTVHVSRVVTAVAGGRILNPRTARSQVMGGVVWGIGTALAEESVIDQALGRFMTHNLADYHVPVHADVRDIEVIFVAERDEVVNPLGAKGLGEIGVVGVAAAVANAVYHATGVRVRELPITLDKVLR
jgi:xanthine dehydrogenase YagR molybdenum-binding subunit